MKFKMLTMALLVSCFTWMANAQPGPQNKPDGKLKLTPEMRADKMAEVLSLSDAEKAKLLNLLKAQDVKMSELREKMKELREKNEQPTAEMREKFQELRKSSEAEIEKILGSEKAMKWKAEVQKNIEKVKEFKNNRPQHQGQTPPPPPPAPNAKMKEKMKEHFTPERRAEMLKNQLQLTDQQSSALTELFKQQSEKMKEQSKKLRDQMQKENDAEIEKIIGKDNMKKLADLRTQMKDKAEKKRNK